MKPISKEIDINLLRTLLKKYSANIYAMYVEYPHKSFWSEKFNDEDYRAALNSLFSSQKDASLLLYLHLPYCPRQCFFCSCYSIFTRDYERVKRYQDYLFREIDLLRDFFDKLSIKPNVKEIHIGGGSPTYLKKKEFEQLIDKVQSLCDIKQTREVCIEIDPRATTQEDLLYYHSKGINRISIGVQDFDPAVQKAVNRVQPVNLTEKLLRPEIRQHFTSVNFDILCGLPRQTVESFKKTIDTVINLSPDRIALLFLHYVPELRKHQRFMKVDELPDLYERTAFFHDAIQRLINGGYKRIGFDHFAKPTDSLTEAMERKEVHWNGLGYRPGKFMDIISVGASSASRITEHYYSQNVYPLSDYETALKNGKFPVYRGYRLNNDEIIRRDIIHRLRSYFFLDCLAIETQYNINFKKYFQEEGTILDEFAKDGIIELSGNAITITDVGKYFTFLVCRIFDKLNRVEKTLQKEK